MKTFISKDKNNAELLGQKVKSFSVKALKNLAVVVFWLFVWYIVYFIVNKEILVVSPFKTMFNVVSLLQDKIFWQTMGLSIFRILFGFLSATAVGVILAICTAKFKLLEQAFNPILTVIKTTPVASFTVLTLVFIKSFYIPIFISFLMVLPIVWSNTFKGIKKTDPKLLEMAEVFNLSTANKIKKIYIPSILPYFTSAFTVGIGFAWKSGVAAEVIANTKLSIGAQIYNAKIYLDTENLFAWTAIIIIFSLILEKVIVKLINMLNDKFIVKE